MRCRYTHHFSSSCLIFKNSQNCAYKQPIPNHIGHGKYASPPPSLSLEIANFKSVILTILAQVSMHAQDAHS